MATKTAKPAKSAKPAKVAAKKGAADKTPEPGQIAHSFPRRSTGEADVLPIARRLGKLMCQSLRQAFQPLAEERLAVEPEEPQVVSHDDWWDKRESPTGYAFYQLPPMKGRMAMLLPQDLIAALVDAFFGGSISRGKSAKKGFSSSDLRLMHRIAQSGATEIGIAWAQIGPFRCIAAGFTDDEEEVMIAKGDAPLLVQPFTLTYPGNVSFTIECVYPVDMIQSAREFCTTARPEETAAADPAWHQAMGQAVAETWLPVRSVMARPSMTMNELANLKEGDIISIPNVRNLQLLIGDRPFARGNIGEQNGMAAFRIDHFEQGKTS
jgi:flagellar motor switch protein FliM